MKTLTLSPNQLQSGADVVELLEREDLKRGDKVEFVLDEDSKALLIIGVLMLFAAGLLYFFNKQAKKEERIAEGGRILEDLYASKNAAELEREIEAEYGIEIEFVTAEADAERDEWQRLAIQSLNASYGDDEPDYSYLLSEDNPDYKPNPGYKS